MKRKKIIKIMFNKYWSDLKMPSKVRPTRWIFELHNLQEHLSGPQFLFLDLNINKCVTFLQSSHKIFQSLALKEAIVSLPYLAEFTLLLLRVFTFRKVYVKFLNLKISSVVTGFKPFFVLKILIASVCMFVWCIDAYFALKIA